MIRNPCWNLLSTQPLKCSKQLVTPSLPPFHPEALGLCLHVDNEAIYGICHCNWDIKYPIYTRLNWLISQIVLQLPPCVWLVPSMWTSQSPRPIWPLPPHPLSLGDYSHVVSAEKDHHEQLLVSGVTNVCSKASNQMGQLWPSPWQIMACSTMEMWYPSMWMPPLPLWRPGASSGLWADVPWVSRQVGGKGRD